MIEKVLADYKVNPRNLKGIDETKVPAIIKEIQDDLRDMYKNKQMPSTDGTKLSRVESGEKEA